MSTIEDSTRASPQHLHLTRLHTARCVTSRLIARRAYTLDGVLHVVHNCTKELSNIGLRYWEAFHEGLSQICKLLSQQWSKDRLIQTCFDTMPAAAHKRDIECFNYTVYPGRWGTLLVAAQELSRLEHVIRRYWSLQRYQFDGAAVAAANNRAWISLRVDAVNDAIQSTLFWTYLNMITHAAAALLQIAGWSEGCPCHQEDLEELGARRWRDLFRKRVDESACPMKVHG